jgi:hypothetical protein
MISRSDPRLFLVLELAELDPETLNKSSTLVFDLEGALLSESFFNIFVKFTGKIT